MHHRASATEGGKVADDTHGGRRGHYDKSCVGYAWQFAHRPKAIQASHLRPFWVDRPDLTLKAHLLTAFGGKFRLLATDAGDASRGQQALQASGRNGAHSRLSDCYCSKGRNRAREMIKR